MRDLLGGKGAGLAEMTNLGLPVPPGFTITTQMCLEFYNQGKKMPSGLADEILDHMKTIEQKMGKVSAIRRTRCWCRCAPAPGNMPGMMDTVLNLGLNEETVKGLAALTNDERFAYDAYRRFIQMFSDVVLGLRKRNFEEMLHKKKQALNVKEDSELSAAALKELAAEFKAYVKKTSGKDFPETVKDQLLLAVQAVFESWNNERATVYRDKEGIPHDLGTAVNVQSMAFGNMGADCGTGFLHAELQ